MELYFSTGIGALDEVLHGVFPGDNIVFQVERIEDYVPFVHAFCIDGEKNNRTLIYFRFAEHESLLPENIKAETFELHPESGFEHFIDEIFTIIEKYGRGACYVFDSLSDLAVDWYSDRMLANFFMLTCPYLFDFETGTYFAILRNHHSQDTISKIHNTAQVILDVYKKLDKMFIHPLKVWKRYSPTMYMLHIWEDKKFIPVFKSAEISEILAEYAQLGIDPITKTQDLWSRTFNKAYLMLQDFEQGHYTVEDLKPLKEKIILMAITRDPKLYPLAIKYLDIKDLINIGQRMIGTGLIGGKSVGLLLSQKILKNSNPKWEDKLEKHDSFFIGSDVFYTYLVINNCWWKRYQIRKSEDFLELASEAREILEKGKFPAEIERQFKNILNYYGQSPIIIRSSSLLEDAYGSAFSGKYESIFLANQGTPEERLKNFMNAVRTVYKSTMSDKALIYRARRGLLDKDEQMAILVQRVSGSKYGELFYPQLSGVGYSYNPYAWNLNIDPNSGLIRIVFGLGTRAVDRHDDDYTRIVALNAPLMRPEGSLKDKQQYNQRKVDILNLKENRFATRYFNDVVNESDSLSIELLGSRDYEAEKKLRKLGKNIVYYILDLDKVLLKSSIIDDMKKILSILEKAYDYPVDIEFTINFLDENIYKIYILQCRPFQFKIGHELIEKPEDINQNNIIFRSEGPIIGNGIIKSVDQMIYVEPEAYSNLKIQEKFKIAQLIGKVNQKATKSEKNIILIGPGRWATSDPDLGVPVKFHEINNVSIICEITEMHQNLCADASLGTHFFNDLVENDMLYVAINPRKNNSFINKQLIELLENNFLLSKDFNDILGEFKDVIKIFENFKYNQKNKLMIYANQIHQLAILYLESGD